MASINRSLRYPSVKTHEGGKASKGSNLMQLRRVISTCLLFENTFYEKGSDIADSIFELAKHVSLDDLINEIVRAKNELMLRHSPMWLALALTKYHEGYRVGETIDLVIKRADELAEFLAMYWKRNGKGAPLSKQVKVGLAKAFGKFDEYQFAKWNRDNEVKLRDVMFMVHPKPENKDRAKLYKRIAEDTLATPDTWEVRLSAATTPEERREVWTDLIASKKLGALALIRNLKNMEKDNVSRKLVVSALENAKTDGILPYQFVAAWYNAPDYAKQIDEMAMRSVKFSRPLHGRTILLVDVSSSMDASLSEKSDMTRWMAAGALASHLVSVSEDISIYTFSSGIRRTYGDFSRGITPGKLTVPVQAIPGFGIIKAIGDSQAHHGTMLAESVRELLPAAKGADRFIVITDEQMQSNMAVPNTGAGRQYIVNVAPYKYGAQYSGSWTRIDGFSQAIVSWIAQEEENPLFNSELD